MLHRVLQYCWELSRNQWLEPAELRHLQETRLRNIVNHAYNSVPLYRDKYDKFGITPESIRTMGDITKLPFTTKQEVKDGLPERSVSAGFPPDQRIKVSTSGTSGGPMPVYYDTRFMDYCMAAWRLRKPLAIGVKPWQKVMVIEHGGAPDPRKEQGVKGGGESRRRSRARQSLGPVIHLLRGRYRTSAVASDAQDVLTELVHFDPKLVRGPPSCLRMLAEAMADRGMETLGNRVVRTEGEVTDDETRKYLESAFRCPVFDEYSAWDFGNGAWQCTRKEGYHIDADMLIMEVVKDGEPASVGETGEIVVTNLLNFAMPLIRYRVGDLGVLREGTCSCGRGLPMFESVQGRVADCVKLPDGRLVTPRSLMGAIQGAQGVSRYQAVQEGTNKLRIELMMKGDEPPVSREELTERCRKVLGDGVEIEVSTAGRENLKAKFRPVISRLTVADEPRWSTPRSGA